MAIHHAQIKKAEKLGFTLTEEADIGKVRAFWPKRAVAVYGNSAADAMAQMQAAIAISTNEDYRVVTDIGDSRLIHVDRVDGMRLAGGPMPPVAAHGFIFGAGGSNADWVDPVEMTGDPEPELPEDDEQPNGERMAEELEKLDKLQDQAVAHREIVRINGIAINGGVAFAEGTPAGDCPYSSETEDEAEYANFERWNDEWDAAADEKSDDENGGGTVVADKYRAKYAEAGHATHCGDWLAETINGIVLNKEGTNIELFEMICNLNGVEMTKYKREGRGWEGRFRMTGRNLMAKRVFLAGGKLVLPQTIHGGALQATPEWMDTMSKRYKTSKPSGTNTQTNDADIRQGAPE